MTWLAMRSRCHNPKSEKFPLYGGRGVTVCDRWRSSFEAFLQDMGERPSGKTIDRVDGRCGYTKSNCRWATPKEQGENSDRAAKGWRREITHCPAGHPYAGDNVRVDAKGYRTCRACDRTRAQANRDRKKING